MFTLLLDDKYLIVSRFNIKELGRMNKAKRVFSFKILVKLSDKVLVEL